jgi:kumamolisin
MATRQDRVELKGSARAALPGGKDVGPADPNQQIEVSVLLRRGSKDANFAASVDQVSSSLPRDREYLTREEFAKQHGASTQDIEKIRAFAAEYGLKVASEDRASRTVKLTGTVQAFNEAFSVSLHRWEHPSGTYRCRTGALTIPADLDGIIEGVLGLDNRPQSKPHFRLRKKNPSVQSRATDVSYSPLQVAKAYAFPSGATGSGQCVALIELGGGYNASDLTQFFSNLGISAPKVTAISVDGATNSPTGEASGPDGEVELDIEVAGSVAPGAQIAVYFAPNTDQGFIDAITTAVHDATLKPSIISISWGGPEDSWTAQSRNALNSACQDASTMGVTVLAASGDNGSTDGSASGAPTVDFPASSPFLVGCGGTKLTLAGSAIGSEQTWNELSANEGATGGGVSQFFALPSFQQSANVPKAPNGFVGRGVPDVAGDADPATGYNVLVDGQQSVIGGTSAVAPLWAGLFALINQSLGVNVGYINPLLYSAKAEATFHDITTGNNGTYSAGPGWDACTGLGSPNGAALLTALRGS